jgi:heme exporter protein CcmD
MEDAGFIFLSYGITLVSIGLYAAYVLRKARRLGRSVRDEELPWT